MASSLTESEGCESERCSAYRRCGASAPKRKTTLRKMKIKTSILTLAFAAIGFAFVIPDAGAVPPNKFPGVSHRADRAQKPRLTKSRVCPTCNVAVERCKHYAAKAKKCCGNVRDGADAKKTKKIKPYWKRKVSASW